VAHYIIGKGSPDDQMKTMSALASYLNDVHRQLRHSAITPYLDTILLTVGKFTR
jgi:hypothetical protein